MSKDDLCQADSTALGSDGIAPEGALQSGFSPEAVANIFHPDQLRVWSGELLAGLGEHMADPNDYEDVIARRGIIERFLVTTIADRVIDFLLPENTQSPIEEPGTGDTDGAEQPGSSLTQKFESQAQKVINWNVAPGISDFTALHAAISSALSTSYKEGRRDEAIARRLAFEEAMRAAKGPVPIPASKAYCAFCGQGDAEVGMDKLVEGPTVCICEFCVENALLVLDSRKASANA